MNYVQAIEQADSLIPNGNFVQGLAYWEASADEQTLSMQHVKFFTDHEEDVSLKQGEPKYGLSAGHSVWCRLTRNDLFEYPSRRFLENLVSYPVGPKSIEVLKASPGDFHSRATDWGTTYDGAMRASTAQLRLSIDDAMNVVVGSEFSWTRPDGTQMAVAVVSEEAPTTEYRSFVVARVGGGAITDADTGGTMTEPFGTATVYPIVTKTAEHGSAVVVNAANADYSGYYTVEQASQDLLRLVRADGVTPVVAETGDALGVVYNYNAAVDPTRATFRVFGDLVGKGVQVGDYFVVSAPFHSYGAIQSISVLSGVQELTVDATVKAPPDTGTGIQPVSKWLVATPSAFDIDLPLPAVRYELTVVFTAQTWSNWNVKLEFTTEQGLSQKLATVIDSIQAVFVRSFPVSTGSTYTRRVYRITADRPFPIPGEPRLKFERISGSISIAHVAMFRGDLTSLISTDYDTLEYSASPDGGAVPRGVIVPFIGGSSCPPGWKEVVGVPSDGSVVDSPSAVEYVFTNFKPDSFAYDSARDITTLRFNTLPLLDFSKDGYTYYPWASFRMRMPVIMRPPPYPPQYKFQIKICGKKYTIFTARFPQPNRRHQRYADVEIGALAPKIRPGQIMQVIGDPVTGKFVPSNYPQRPDSISNAIIGAIRVMPEFRAYEEGYDTLPYPSSYKNLVSELNFDAMTPTPDGILTLIRATKSIFDQLKAAVLYDPHRLGEPEPNVHAEVVGSAIVFTEIDLLGDWRKLKDVHMPSARIIRTGYVKMSTDSPSIADPGSEEHNHRVRKSSLTPISGVAARTSQVMSSDNPDRPPVAVNHGHGYLGAGGYSRPFGRGVKLCVKL